jgi:hypothetical protein
MSVMSNPNFQRIAQTMMQDPNMSNVMNQFGGMGLGRGNNLPNLGNLGNFDFNNMNPYNNTQSQPKINNNFKPKETVFIDDKKIICYDSSNIVQVFKKINSICNNFSIKLSNEEEKTLKDLESYLGDPKSKREILITSNTFTLLYNFFIKFSEPDLFPLLDIFRLLVLSDTVTEMALIQEENNIFNLIEKYLEKFKTLSKSTKIMILRVYCNIFNMRGKKIEKSNKILEKTIYKKFEILIEIISECFSDVVDAVKLTACALACNISLHPPGTNETLESVTQILSTMAEFVGKETDEDTIFRMFLCIYRLINENPDFKEIVNLILPKNVYEKEFKSEDIKNLLKILKKNLI